MPFELLRQEVARHPYPLLFATFSGAHLYGFPSPDSDFDLRGVHVLPPREVVGLLPLRETIESTGWREGLEIDLVTHDAKKFFNMVLKRNGYVLEQLFSPLTVVTTPEHEELKSIASLCITRWHHHHYLGFAANQWRMFEQEDPPRVKPLLYVLRVLLTGIHLMRTGEVQANLPTLNEHFQLSYIPDLIARKTEGAEKSRIENPEREFYRSEYLRLSTELEQAGANSSLRSEPEGLTALNDLLIRLRLNPRS